VVTACGGGRTSATSRKTIAGNAICDVLAPPQVSGLVSNGARGLLKTVQLSVRGGLLLATFTMADALAVSAHAAPDAGTSYAFTLDFFEQGGRRLALINFGNLAGDVSVVNYRADAHLRDIPGSGTVSGARASFTIRLADLGPLPASFKWSASSVWVVIPPAAPNNVASERTVCPREVATTAEGNASQPTDLANFPGH